MAVQLAPHVPKMASDDGVVAAAKKALGDALIDASDHVGEISLTVQREAIVNVCRALRDTAGLEYQQLMEIAGVDYPERPERFEVVYHLLSLTRNRSCRSPPCAMPSAPTSFSPLASNITRPFGSESANGPAKGARMM